MKKLMVKALSKCMYCDKPLNEYEGIFSCNGCKKLNLEAVKNENNRDGRKRN